MISKRIKDMKRRFVNMTRGSGVIFKKIIKMEIRAAIAKNDGVSDEGSWN